MNNRDLLYYYINWKFTELANSTLNSLKRDIQLSEEVIHVLLFHGSVGVLTVPVLWNFIIWIQKFRTILEGNWRSLEFSFNRP